MMVVIAEECKISIVGRVGILIKNRINRIVKRRCNHNSLIINNGGKSQYV